MIRITKLPREEWPPLDAGVLASTDALAAINDGALGYAGIVWTSRTANEAFLWYVPRDQPTVSELRMLKKILYRFRPNVWMTIDRSKPHLIRWARFMGLEYVAPYGGQLDRYRRP